MIRAYPRLFPQHPETSITHPIASLQVIQAGALVAFSQKNLHRGLKCLGPGQSREAVPISTQAFLFCRLSYKTLDPRRH
jgi:hypothetical protein